jgi:NAD-dependent DNA ligase
MSDIQRIVSQIQEARKIYYSTGGIEGERAESPLSDDEFDALIDRLRLLDPQNPELAVVGSSPSNSIWQKRRHTIAMGSLTKVKGTAGLKIWWDKTSSKAS